MSDETIRKYLDLLGVIVTSTFISYTFYDSLLDRITGEVSYPGLLMLQVLLVFGSYLSVFLPASKFERLLDVPRWIWVSVMGSLAAALTCMEPLASFEIGQSVSSFFAFTIFSAFVFAPLNFVGAVINEIRGNRGSSHLLTQGVTSRHKTSPLPSRPPTFPQATP